MAGGDKFKQDPITLNAPASNFFDITPHDTNELAQYTRGIYVGSAGDLVVIGAGDSVAVTIKNAAVGWHPIRAKIVKSTGTVAALLVGAY